ncbi:uncharacterized protein HfgLR_13875 [Haloferax gibbonsii]|uniref:Uncharacterized protein n=1 Tax=Haloferax gibbonsii TaxID=35746 RepID=A0A871BJQ8_HALGI|nr:hypothetical protein [Haloferax gibbonsii]QOS12903.1 uncharacterized protein HfgLR_13875 [Haloferax gibbonsii]
MSDNNDNADESNGLNRRRLLQTLGATTGSLTLGLTGTDLVAATKSGGKLPFSHDELKGGAKRKAVEQAVAAFEDATDLQSTLSDRDLEIVRGDADAKRTVYNDSRGTVVRVGLPLDGLPGDIHGAVLWSDDGSLDVVIDGSAKSVVGQFKNVTVDDLSVKNEGSQGIEVIGADRHVVRFYGESTSKVSTDSVSTDGAVPTSETFAVDGRELSPQFTTQSVSSAIECALRCSGGGSAVLGCAAGCAACPTAPATWVALLSCLACAGCACKVGCCVGDCIGDIECTTAHYYCVVGGVVSPGQAAAACCIDYGCGSADCSLV